MQKKIYTTTKEGNKIEYDVILTFKNNKNNKDYVVYTDNELDNQKKLKIYAATYNPLTNEFIDVPESKEEYGNQTFTPELPSEQTNHRKYLLRWYSVHRHGIHRQCYDLWHEQDPHWIYFHSDCSIRRLL